MAGTAFFHQGKRAILAVLRDVTERKRAAAALRESEAWGRGVMDNVADGVITIDEAGRIESFNPAAEAMFGYRAEEMIGRNVSELMTAADNDCHDEYLRRYRETGQGAIIGIGPREVAARRKDGSVFGMELTVGEMRSGQRHIFIGAMRDISKRKRAEQALHESRTLLDAVVNSAPLVLWAVDSEGTVTLSEGRGLDDLGLQAGEMVGRPISDFATARDNVARALAGEEFAEVIELGDKVFQTFYRPLRHPNGDIEGVMGVDVDITELKRAETALVAAKEEAEFANRAKSEFLANTSHELRTPLNAIIGFADMLVGGYVGKLDAKQAEYVGDIRESGAALLEIINDILDLTRIESGASPLTEDILKVAPTVTAAVRLIRSPCGRGRSAAHRRCARGPAAAEGRPANGQAHSSKPLIERREVHAAGRRGDSLGLDRLRRRTCDRGPRHRDRNQCGRPAKGDGAVRSGGFGAEPSQSRDRHLAVARADDERATRRHRRA